MSKLAPILLATFLAGAAFAQTGTNGGTATGALGAASAPNGAASAPGRSASAPGRAGTSTAPGLVCPPGLEKRDNNCVPPGQAR